MKTLFSDTHLASLSACQFLAWLITRISQYGLQHQKICLLDYDRLIKEYQPYNRTLYQLKIELYFWKIYKYTKLMLKWADAMRCWHLATLEEESTKVNLVGSKLLVVSGLAWVGGWSLLPGSIKIINNSHLNDFRNLGALVTYVIPKRFQPFSSMMSGLFLSP